MPDSNTNPIAASDAALQLLKARLLGLVWVNIVYKARGLQSFLRSAAHIVG